MQTAMHDSKNLKHYFFVNLSGRRKWVFNAISHPLRLPGNISGSHFNFTGEFLGLMTHLDWCRKTCPSLGFDLQTVQHIESGYTD
jgi:hypothetical protein